MIGLWKKAPEKAGADKRRGVRHACNFALSLLDAGRRPVARPVFLVDMSRFGLGMRTDLPFAVGDTLGVQLAVAGEGAIAASCVVRWVRPEGILNSYGLEFRGLDRRQQKLLGTLVEPPVERDWIGYGLQLAASVVLSLVFVDIVRSNEALGGAAVGVLPYLFIFGGSLLGLWAAFKGR